MTTDPDDEGLREAAARVGWRLRAGAFLTAGLMVLLAFATSLSVVEVLALPVFFVLLPALAVAQLPLLDWEPLERVPVYIGSIVTILGVGALGAILSMRLEGVAPAGLLPLPTVELLAWTLGTTLAAFVVILLFRPLEQRIGGGRSALLRDLLPQTRRERRLFVGLSFSAGIGEELAYRGYAYQAVQLLGLGPWGAALISSVPFAFLHAYQGPVGILRTGTMGFILAVPVVMTGSLLPSMAAHALIDLLIGLVLGPYLLTGHDEGVVLPGVEE
jgi:hypothetical protein